MLVYDLFRPATCDGAIIRLKHSADAAYQPFRWDAATRSWLRSDIAIDRFISLPRATLSDLSAAGLTLRDMDEPN